MKEQGLDRYEGKRRGAPDWRYWLATYTSAQLEVKITPPPQLPTLRVTLPSGCNLVRQMAFIPALDRSFARSQHIERLIGTFAYYLKRATEMKLSVVSGGKRRGVAAAADLTLSEGDLSVYMCHECFKKIIEK